MSEDIDQQFEQRRQQVEQLYQAREFEQALGPAIQACDLAAAQYGENHPAFIMSVRALADIYQALGRLADAEPLHRQAVEALRQWAGDEHPMVIDTMMGLGETYEAQGRYAEAEPLYRRVSESYYRTEGGNSPSYARSLHNLALLYQRMGDLDRAEPLYRQAVEIVRQSLGDSHPIYSLALGSLASFYKETRKYELAEPLYRQLIDIRRKRHGDTHPDTARSLTRLAEIHEATGRYAEAEQLYRQVCFVFLETLGAKDREFIASVLKLANVYRQMGAFRDAEPHFRQALEFGRQAYGEADPDYAVALTDLAALYWMMGRYAQAEPLLRQALTIRRTTLGETHHQVAETLNGLGQVLWALGNYDTADPLLRQALAIRRTTLGEAHPEFANSLNNLGELYRSMGNYAAAAPLYQRAIEVFGRTVGPDTVQFAGAVHNLADLYTQVRAFEAAEPLYRQALDILVRRHGEKDPRVATVLNGLAILAALMGDPTTAVMLLERVRDIQRQTLGEQHEGYAITLNNLASIAKGHCDREVALRLFRQASDILRTALGEDHPNYVTSLYNLASFHAETGGAEQAFDLMEEAARRDDRILAQLFSVGSESQRMAYLNNLRTNLYGFLSLVRQFFADDPARVGVACDLVLRRKAIGAEAMAVQRDAVLGGRYPHLASKLAEWSALRTQIAARLLAGSGAEDAQAQRKVLAQWNSQREQIEQELAAEIPEMRLERRLQDQDRRAVAGALPAGTVLVEFVHTLVFEFGATKSTPPAPTAAARYLAFVIAAGTPDDVWMIDLGDAGAIDRMIAAFRSSITRDTEGRGPAGAETTAAASPVGSGGVPVALRGEIVAATRHLTGRPDAAGEAAVSGGPELRAAAFDPLLPSLKGCKVLFLAPDGDLARLPFEVLPTGTDRYLIDDYHISYVGVGRDVLRFGVPSTGRPSAPFVAADPDFDLGGAPARSAAHRPLFPRLAGARQEGQTIAAMLGVPALVGDAVLETTVKRLRSPRLLHLATHGLVLPNPPPDLQGPAPPGPPLLPASDGLARLRELRLANPLMRSVLALAGANTWLRNGALPSEAEDGLLFAEDITGLDLLDTELVVLSACQTGLGDIQVGEGVFGLRRAVGLAGAKTLVMSLWKVPDRQTYELMVDFYERLLTAVPRADALRQAQLAVKAQHPDPLYWGAFICQGDPGPLPEM